MPTVKQLKEHFDSEELNTSKSTREIRAAYDKIGIVHREMFAHIHESSASIGIHLVQQAVNSCNEGITANLSHIMHEMVLPLETLQTTVNFSGMLKEVMRPHESWVSGLQQIMPVTGITELINSMMAPLRQLTSETEGLLSNIGPDLLLSSYAGTIKPPAEIVLREPQILQEASVSVNTQDQLLEVMRQLLNSNVERMTELHDSLAQDKARQNKSDVLEAIQAIFAILSFIVAILGIYLQLSQASVTHINSSSPSSIPTVLPSENENR